MQFVAISNLGVFSRKMYIHKILEFTKKKKKIPVCQHGASRDQNREEGLECKTSSILKFFSRDDYGLLSHWGLQLLCVFRLVETRTWSGSKFSWSWEVWCVVRDLVESCIQAMGSSGSQVTVRASPPTDLGYTWVLFGAVLKMSCIPVLLFFSVCSALLPTSWELSGTMLVFRMFHTDWLPRYCCT